MLQKNYSLILKDTVEEFTKKLFYALFDEVYYKDHISFIEKLFLEIADTLKIKESISIWVTLIKKHLKKYERN